MFLRQIKDTSSNISLSAQIFTMLAYCKNMEGQLTTTRCVLCPFLTKNPQKTKKKTKTYLGFFIENIPLSYNNKYVHLIPKCSVMQTVFLNQRRHKGCMSNLFIPANLANTRNQGML